MRQLMMTFALSLCVVACQSAPAGGGGGSTGYGTPSGANGCSIASTQACQGCSVSCPSDKRPVCKPALEEPGLEPFRPNCVEPAQCRCV